MPDPVPDYAPARYWANRIHISQENEAVARERLAEVCQELKQAGASDREIAEQTGFSRARIQQLRTGKHG